MRHRMLLVVGLVAVLTAAPAAAQQAGAGAGDSVFAPVADTSLKWNPAAPPGFGPGMELAVVHGDPAVADEPYVIRLRFADGYRFPPHFHPVAENVTVLDGAFHLAMGEAADSTKLQTYRPGDYLFIEGNHPHFGGATGRTVIQLHGTGPFTIITVGSPEDKR